ncbi:MAG: hypothetical protein QX189_14000 [Methylococcales bacterium]
MNAKQVNQLYKQLTPKELANLTIETINKGLPSKELELIKDSLSTALYRLPAWEYRHHIQGYEQLSWVYGLHFWKNVALLNMCHEVMDSDLIPEQDSRECFNAYKIYAGRLISLDLALIKVCNKAKFDINAVYWLAEVSETDKRFKALIPVIEPYNLVYVTHSGNAGI